MRHAAHKAAKVSNERFSVAKALFTSSRGSHTAKAVRMVQLAMVRVPLWVLSLRLLRS